MILSEQQARYVLIHQEGDAAGWNDADEVGDHSFVETLHTFITAKGNIIYDTHK